MRRDDLSAALVPPVRVALGVACLLVGMGSMATAQGPNPGLAADAYAASAKKNAELMQKYTWKMRVQITYKGETKPASLYQMNYVNGQLQKTMLSAPPPERPVAKHGIKHRIKEAEDRRNSRPGPGSSLSSSSVTWRLHPVP